MAQQTELQPNALPGQRHSFAAKAAAVGDAMTACITAVIGVTTGDKYRVRLKRSQGAGDAETIVDASGLTVLRLY